MVAATLESPADGVMRRWRELSEARKQATVQGQRILDEQEVEEDRDGKIEQVRGVVRVAEEVKEGGDEGFESSQLRVRGGQGKHVHECLEKGGRFLKEGLQARRG